MLELTLIPLPLQIISFLQQNAHPRVAERIPSVPENVTDQVIMTSMFRYIFSCHWAKSLNFVFATFHEKQISSVLHILLSIIEKFISCSCFLVLRNVFHSFYVTDKTLGVGHEQG